jgi:hypothetical protein
VTGQGGANAGWDRPRWERGGRNAFVSFAILGDFESGAANAVAQRLPGLSVRRKDHDAVVSLAANLRPSHGDEEAEAFETAMDSPNCLWIVGEVPDPPTLEYLRPLVLTVTDLLDRGASGVVDLNAIVFQGRNTWALKVLDGHIQPFNFVATYWWTDTNGIGQWWHSRGMRTFGRPDISLRHVPDSADRDHVLGVIRRLAVELALGRVLVAGDRAGGLVFDVADASEDPMFLNERVEADWPATDAE